MPRPFRFRLWTIRQWARFSAIMATIAPRTDAETSPRRRPEIPKTLIRAGSVVLHDRAFVVAFEAVAPDRWLGFRLCSQTGPLHRRHVILAPSEAESALPLLGRLGRMIVRTDEPVVLGSASATLGHLDELVLRRVALAMRRDADASTLEGMTRGYA
jgi:hypothetical protein